MEGQTWLKECTVSVAFAKDVDPAIKRLNEMWNVDIDPVELVKEGKFIRGENGVRFVLKLQTVQLYACGPDDAEPRLYTLIGAPADSPTA